MDQWRKLLKYDPISPLLSSENQAIQYFVRRDLLEEEAESIQSLWQLPQVQKILNKQMTDGSWLRAGEKKHPAINYSLIETWRQLRFLIYQYGFTREHPQTQKAAEYLFSCQTVGGDFRGILANQYATYYTGAIMATLIQAGYAEDARIESGFQWLLSMRQDDGGWSIPLITHIFDRATQYLLTTEYAEPVEPDRSKPFSHNWTGMVLRAFAAHPEYRFLEEAKTAAILLKSRFFKADSYTSYQAASYWVRFEYPFWWNNLVSAMDSLSLMGSARDDQHINQALTWLVDHQEESGLWKVTYAKEQVKETQKGKELKLWVSLAICRIFRRFYG